MDNAGSGHDATSIAAIEAVALRLLEYCRENEWAGYDPYDALNSELFSRFPALNARIPRLALTQTLKRTRWNPRRLLRVPKTQNPKGLALFLSSSLILSRLRLISGEDLAETLLDRLRELRSPGSEHWCWGYSFPWQTRTAVVPRGTPNLVCTAFVANS